MPTFDTADQITPRSALRHRPIGKSNPPAGRQPGRATSSMSEGKSNPPVGRQPGRTTRSIPLGESNPPVGRQPGRTTRSMPLGESNPPVGRQPGRTTASIPAVPRASRYRPDALTGDMDDWQLGESAFDESYPDIQLHTVTYELPKTPVPALRTRPGVRMRQVKQQAHPLLYLGIGMLVVVIIATILTSSSGWLGTTFDDLRYGRPRTFQTDAWVGHNEQTGIRSHFIALNLHRHIEVIELPGGDASRAHIYVGPQLFGTNDELVPVTLSFVDVNGDQKPDMIISFGASRVVFLNDQGAFRPLLPSERDQVEQVLRHLGR